MTEFFTTIRNAINGLLPDELDCVGHRQLFVANAATSAASAVGTGVLVTQATETPQGDFKQQLPKIVGAGMLTGIAGVTGFNAIKFYRSWQGALDMLAVARCPRLSRDVGTEREWVESPRSNDATTLLAEANDEGNPLVPKLPPIPGRPRETTPPRAPVDLNPDLDPDMVPAGAPPRTSQILDPWSDAVNGPTTDSTPPKKVQFESYDGVGILMGTIELPPPRPYHYDINGNKVLVGGLAVVGAWALIKLALEYGWVVLFA